MWTRLQLANQIAIDFEVGIANRANVLSRKLVGALARGSFAVRSLARNTHSIEIYSLQRRTPLNHKVYVVLANCVHNTRIGNLLANAICPLALVLRIHHRGKRLGLEDGDVCSDQPQWKVSSSSY